MLHIHNGDSTAGTLREAGFPGEHFAFREVLACGPAPRGLPRDEWVAVRATNLAGLADIGEATIRQEWDGIESVLDGCSARDEVILWFEHDLHCQIDLAYLLTRFALLPLPPKRLSLICIGEYPGIAKFHGLGELSAAQMAGLFDLRHTVTEAESHLARQAWDAYSAPDPRAIERILATDTAALSFLRAAMLHHLARYPSTGNGLGAIENQALQLIAAGHGTFRSLFPAFSDADPICGGLGDLAFSESLKLMAEPGDPLLVIEGSGHNSSLTLTETGTEVLARRRDFLDTHRIDRWLGGVHLTNDRLWRWDEPSQKLLKISPRQP